MHIRRILLAGGFVGASCLLVPGAEASGTSPDPDTSRATWSANCEFVQHLQVDPFGDWGGGTSNHMHSFAAMEDPYDELTPADLRAAPVNDCNSPDLTGLDPEDEDLGVIPDRSAYWTPALRSTNLTVATWIDPATVLVYYRNAGVDPNTIRAFDQDFTFRSGNPNATLLQPQQEYVMRWSCVAQKMGRTGENEVNFQATIPNTCPKYRGGQTDNPYYLRLVVYFPNCVDFDTADRVNGQWIPDDPMYAAELTNPLDDITRYCADPDYDAIPQVQIGYRWPLTTASGIVTSMVGSGMWDLTSLKVSSDDGSYQDNGVTGHADFMSGWSTAELADLMRVCYWDEDHTPRGLGPQNCGAIGDGGDGYEDGEN